MLEFPSVDTVVEIWSRGDVRWAEVAALSDLTRDDAGRLAEAWPALADETRIAVARQLLELSEDRVELHFGRALRLFVTDPSPVVRQLAVAALWEDDSADVVDRLLHIARTDASQDVAAQAVQSLTRSAERAALGELDTARSTLLQDALLGMAADPSAAPIVRRRALEASAVFAEDPRTDRLVEAFFEGDEPGFRASALYAMGRSAAPRWLPLVSQDLRSDDAELRFEAARAAGELGDAQLLPDLIEMRHDDDLEVRQAAIGALGRIGGRAAKRALERLAEDAAESDHEAIDEALLEAETSVDPLTLPR